MKEKEFKLSEKEIVNAFGRRYNGVFLIEDVKEFIRLDWELFIQYVDGEIGLQELREKRNKLAGDKLTK